MKFVTLLFLVISAVYAARWSEQDKEIFAVHHGLQKAEGLNVSFYSFLNLTQTTKSTIDDISKAYKKRSLELHPDKNGGLAEAQKRFERLGLIAKMLRTPEVRERYDFFYVNGFPQWKGEGLLGGYFYSRYRPGIGTAVLLIFLVVSGMHYLGLVVGAASQRKRIQGHIDDARERAGYPFDGNKKKRVTVQETGRIFSVEPSGAVSLVQGGQEFPISVEDVPAVDYLQSLVVRIPMFLYNKVQGRVQKIEKTE